MRRKLLFSILLFTSGFFLIALPELKISESKNPSIIFTCLGALAIVFAAVLYPEGYRYQNSVSRKNSLYQIGAIVLILGFAKLGQHYLNEQTITNFYMLFLGAVWGWSVNRALCVFNGSNSLLDADKRPAG